MKTGIDKKNGSLLDELFRIQQKYSRKISESMVLNLLHMANGEMIYLLLFTLFYLFTYLRTTMVPSYIIGAPIDRTEILFYVLIWAKIILFDIKQKQDFYRILLPEIAGFMLIMPVAQHYPGEYIPIFYMLVIGARNIDFRKIAAISLILGAAMISTITVLSCYNIVEDLVWGTFSSPRHAFGFVYCTDYAAHYFFFFCAYFWLRKGRLRWYDVPVFVAAIAFLYFLCHSRTDCITIGLLLLAGIILNFKSVSDHLLKARWIYILIFIILTVAAFILSFAIDGYEKGTLLSRLYMARTMIMRVGLSLFGVSFSETGNGGSTLPVDPANYSFIDISYVKIVLKYGVIAAAAIIAYLTRLMYKRVKKRDTVTLLMMSLIAINCFVAHHLIDFSYNVFILMLFADLSYCDDNTHRLSPETARKAKHEKKKQSRSSGSIRQEQ